MVIVKDFNNDILKLSKDITETLKRTQEKIEFEDMIKNANTTNYFQYFHITRVIEFYPLETHGIHFEKISTAYISHKKWNIIYNYDLRDLMVAVKTTEKNIMDIETFCKQEPKITCKFITVE